MVFFNSLNFFAIFFEFSISRWVGTKRNDNFFFFSFLAFSNLFCLGMRPQWYILIFQFFCFCFWIFNYASGRNGTEWWFLFSPFLLFIKPILAWKEYIMVFSNFLNFLLFFWNFLSRVGLERNVMIIFIFSLSRPFPTCFDLKESHNGIF